MKILDRYFAVCAVIVAVASGVAAADAPRSDVPTLSLESVLRDVLQNNPSLKAVRANWEAMKQRVPQARAWEDLRAGFDTVAERFVDVPSNSFTDHKLTAKQTLPIAGKNRLQREATAADVNISFHGTQRREI